MIRVYKYGLLAPAPEHAEHVRDQLRAAHEYRNDLVAIERGRRHALRALDDADVGVREAIEALRVATKSTRKAAERALQTARKLARENAADEMARIHALEHTILLAARSATRCYWGSYLDIEAAHRQSRAQPLYGDDRVTPNDPRFVRWRGEGQIGVQLQGGLAVPLAFACADTRARLSLPGFGSRGRRYGALSIRVGSDGRDPVWGTWPIKMHRALPDAATIKWIRVSLRREATREEWSCEITIDTPAVERRYGLGAIAVELEWVPLDDGSMRVATTLDTRGQRGTIVLPARVVSGIRKPDGIRAVRDLTLNEFRGRLATKIREAREPLPLWIRQAGATMHFWKSPERFVALARRWREEQIDAGRDAYDLLQGWELRDAHLWDYEAGARREALRERREIYRVLAARWRGDYGAVLVPDRDLSREARFGPDSDLRFTASPQELRGALANAMGERCVEIPWRGPLGVIVPDGSDELADWPAHAIEQWRAQKKAVSAREGENTKGDEEIKGNAWARRKAKKAEKDAANGTARKPVANAVSDS